MRMTVPLGAAAAMVAAAVSVPTAAASAVSFCEELGGQWNGQYCQTSVRSERNAVRDIKVAIPAEIVDDTAAGPVVREYLTTLVDNWKRVGVHMAANSFGEGNYEIFWRGNTLSAVFREATNTHRRMRGSGAPSDAKKRVQQRERQREDRVLELDHVEKKSQPRITGSTPRRRAGAIRRGVRARSRQRRKTRASTLEMIEDALHQAVGQLDEILRDANKSRRCRHDRRAGAPHRAACSADGSRRTASRAPAAPAGGLPSGRRRRRAPSRSVRGAGGDAPERAAAARHHRHAVVDLRAARERRVVVARLPDAQARAARHLLLDEAGSGRPRSCRKISTPIFEATISTWCGVLRERGKVLRHRSHPRPGDPENETLRAEGWRRASRYLLAITGTPGVRAGF